MIWLLLIWVALLAALIVGAIGKYAQGGALTLSYFLGLSLIHLPGALTYIDPLSSVPGRDASIVGFKMTLLGMAAFVASAMLVRFYSPRPPPTNPEAVMVHSKAFAGLGGRAFVLGITSYFVLMPLARFIPSATSLVVGLATLLIIGLWLRLYSAHLAHDSARMATTLGVLPLLPIATLAGGGFLGFGVYWVLSVVSFLFVVARRRIWFFLLAPLVVVFGLSLFATYMGERTGIRDVVWRQQATLEERLDRIGNMVTEFRIIDLNDPRHLKALNDRLNQNYFVGAGVQRHATGSVDFTYGGTVSPLALIPRVIWPDKPVVGGSGDLVSRFTGIPTAYGTSFGVGAVLEFYMNFGVPGVLIGFAGLAALLMWLDNQIALALATGDVRKLLYSAMPGLILLQPGGSFLEIMVGFVAAAIAARLIIALPVLGIIPARSRGDAGALASSAPDAA